MRVLVGISGGVDSAVAAYILKAQGHDIIGAMMKIYSGATKNPLARSCYGSDKTKEINDAMANCEFVGCDFHLVDVSSEFDDFVFSKFKQEYLNARTPNPCVMCNPIIKFGVFPKKARLLGLEFDKFATGHYVRCEFDENIQKYVLKRAVDTKKDQSYFLYGLSQEVLKNVIFPLGSMTKEQTREYAIKNNIPVAKKQDSQDFYSGSYSDLLECEENSGDIVDTFGNILGQHRGLHNYTIGQRKGLLIAYSEPLYVVGFDTVNNRLIVSTKENTYSKGLFASNINWIFEDRPNKPFDAQIKIRSAQQPFDSVVYPIDNNNVRIEFSTPQSSVAPGQAVVIYNSDIVLGGGTIETSF